MKMRHFIYWPRSVLSGYGTGAQQATARDLPRLSTAAHHPSQAAPHRPGAHNDEVLREWGFDPSAIERLRREGALRD